MRKYAVPLLMFVAVCVLAPSARAQAAPAAVPAVNWLAVTSGFAMAIASAFCGYAQAKATAAACESFARNPGAAAPIRFAIVLALVLIESMALYTFAILAINLFR